MKPRKDYIGGTCISAIMGKSPYKKAEQVWKEKTGLVEPEDISLRPHVAFGVAMESVIRDWVEKKYDKKFNPTFIESQEYPFIAGSLDGLSEDGIVLEIKTIGKEGIVNASMGIVPEHYRMQLQWYMFLAGSQQGLFVAYNKDADEWHSVDIPRDDKLIKEMIAAAIVFWRHVETRTPLNIVSDDMICRIDEWKNAKRALDAAQTVYDVIDEELRADFAKLNIDDLESEGVKFTRYDVKGSIDYSKIEVLKTMDLEQYRKPTTKRVKLTCV
jgi:putative phage-type endonuclease